MACSFGARRSETRLEYNQQQQQSGVISLSFSPFPLFSAYFLPRVLRYSLFLTEATTGFKNTLNKWKESALQCRDCWMFKEEIFELHSPQICCLVIQEFNYRFWVFFRNKEVFIQTYINTFNSITGLCQIKVTTCSDKFSFMASFIRVSSGLAFQLLFLQVIVMPVSGSKWLSLGVCHFIWIIHKTDLF